MNEKNKNIQSKIEKTRKKIVNCDICGKKITTERFKVVWVFDTNREDKFFHGSMDGVEKEIITCNDCIEYLNFRKSD